MPVQCARWSNEAGAAYAVSTVATRPGPVDTAIIAGPGPLLVSVWDAWPPGSRPRLQTGGSNNRRQGLHDRHALARLCYDNLAEYGLAAKVAGEAGAVTPRWNTSSSQHPAQRAGFESGVASHRPLHPQRPDRLPHPGYYHGEKVAIGVLTSLFLTDKPKALIDEVYTFCESVAHHLRIWFSPTGAMTNCPAAERACIPEEFIHREATEITPQAILFALKTANGEGMRRKGGKE